MYLAIDLWDKKCWIAITVENVVMPKDIVPRTLIISKVRKFVKEYGIEVIVVWLPYDLYNENLRQLNKTKAFIRKLKDIFPKIKIESIDERFTSFEAWLVLDDMKIKDKIWKKDDISAVLILESYLKQKSQI